MTLLDYLCVVLLVLLTFTSASYEEDRAALVALRQQSRFDAAMRSRLSDDELRLNATLMSYKHTELSKRDANGSRLIQQPFANMYNSILASPLYAILQDLPKGGVLHAHWDSLVAAAWLVKNASYEDHCWMDVRPGPSYGAMRFSLRQPAEGYQLISEVRKTAPQGVEEFDAALISLLESTPNAFEPYKNAWGHFQQYFPVVDGLLFYTPVLEQYFRYVFNAFSHRNAVMHLELRFNVDASMYDLNGTTFGPHDTIALLQRIALEFSPLLSVRAILTSYKPAISPTELPAQLWLAAELTAGFPDFVVGWDGVGQEEASPSLHDYAPALMKGKRDLSLNYYLHAGETAFNGNDSSADNLVDAALLSRRIGHGYALTKHPELVPLLLKRQVAVEVCPISNQVLGYAQNFQNHPATWMMEVGLPVTLSPDDPGSLGYDSVTSDWWVAFVTWDMDLASLKQLAYNSLEYSALEGAKKEAALSRWHEQWAAYVRRWSRVANNDIAFIHV